MIFASVPPVAQVVDAWTELQYAYANERKIESVVTMMGFAVLGPEGLPVKGTTVNYELGAN
jgi:hypothetical protein